jgi:uncharacterized protein YjbI with pentapeptide repeats
VVLNKDAAVWISQRFHRAFIAAYILMAMAVGKGQPTPKGAKEVKGKPWTLREVRGTGKTTWEWMELFLVPLALALITIVFSAYQTRLQQANEAQRAENEALQAYLEQMGQWLIEQDLDQAQQDDNIAKVARARTLTILGGADDPIVKRRVIQFLHETNLISAKEQISDEPPISMNGADLRESDLYVARQSSTNLSGTDLSNDVLSGVDLSRSDLRDANLRNTNLSQAAMIDTELGNANLRGANLSGADLTGANLEHAKVSQQQLEQVESLQGAIMPDGSTHP